MAFQLKIDRSLRANIRRLVLRQMARVDDAIASNEQPRAEIVHEVRKCCKRIRALLRLVHDPLGKETYRQANTFFRDAVRPLAEVRDTKVIVDALNQFTNSQPDSVVAHAIETLRPVVQEEKTIVETHVLEQQVALASVAAALNKERKRLRDWRLPRKQARTLRQGLKRCYRQARGAWREARMHPSPALLHEWRKQAKYLWHLLELLQPLSRRFARRSDDMHELTKLLGDYRDLFLLRQKVVSLLPSTDADARAKLLHIIDEQCAHLIHDAFELGRRVFDKSPKSFVASPAIRQKQFQGEK